MQDGDQQLTVAFTEFGFSELARSAEIEGLPLEGCVRKAVRELASSISSVSEERRPYVVPDFARGPEHPDRRRLQVELPDAELDVLADEAERQGVELERLIEHAVVSLLAADDHHRASRPHECSPPGGAARLPE